MPAPAADPRFIPTLNPSGPSADWSHRMQRSIADAIAACSAGFNSVNSSTSRYGTIRRCPLLYGYRFMMMKTSSPRQRMRFFESASSLSNLVKRDAPSFGTRFFASETYSDRQGLHMRSIEPTWADGRKTETLSRERIQVNSDEERRFSEHILLIPRHRPLSTSRQVI